MKRAFTLIELLVVIAIIAILAAILFPVFAQAKNAAKTSACVSNEKQFLLGFQMYANDYDDMFMPAYTSNPNVLWNQLFQPYIKNTDVFRCPAQSKPGITGWVSQNPPAGVARPFAVSYVANMHIMGDGQTPLVTGGVATNFGQVAQSSATVLLADGGSRALSSKPSITDRSENKDRAWLLNDPVKNAFANMACCASLTAVADASNPDWAGPSPRHAGKTATGFVDGHVKVLDPNRWYYPNTPWLDPLVGGQ